VIVTVPMNDSGGNDQASTVPFWFHRSRPTPAQSREVDEPCDAFDPDSGISRVLVLNLDRQPERWDLFQAEARHHGLRDGGSLLDRCERVAAVDGLAAPVGSYSSSEIDGTYSLEDFYFVDPQPVLSTLENRLGVEISESPQEMAVAQSHLNIWKQVANDGVTTLVVEDDVQFLHNFDSRLGRIWAELSEVETREHGFDLLYVSYRSVDTGARKTICSESLFRPIRGLWWLSGYVLTPRGAGTLLDALPIKGPVDQWMNHQLGRLNAYASSTPLVVQRRQWRSDNSYSIIPVLRSIRGATAAGRASETGMSGPDLLQSNPTGDASPDRRKAPVFAIGLNKTGTTSLHEALILLGYRSCHWQSDEFSDETSALIDGGGPLPFEAYTDVASIIERYEELDRRFPSAMFILTVRNLDDWLASRARHVALNRAENALEGQDLYGWIDIDPLGWRTERLMHHEAVLRYFKDRPHKLLVMDICEGDGWADLCRFLDCPEPREPFPHADPLAARKPIARQRLGSLDIRHCKIQLPPHDDYPWITKAAERSASPEEELKRVAALGRVGSFAPLFNDRFQRFDSGLWVKVDDTFDTNLAVFRPANVSIVEGSGLRLTLQTQKCRDRAYTAGAVASPDEHSRRFTYGRFEAEIKPARANGVLSGMFLYRRDPWQEIDLEFLGARPDHMLLDVYYNPGDEGDLYNYGMRGTPVLIDLGFDASETFHHYAIEWEPSGMRWFVDGDLVFARVEAPTPIPHLPLRLYLNAWPIDAEELAGTVDPARLPVTTDVRSITVSSWIPPLADIATSGNGRDGWRRDAE
jgi:beta-glucanase (GH16 family)/GR25 family glycosyltransferase involved in LPS biosynthesis